MDQKSGAIPGSAMVVEVPQDSVPGAGRPAMRAQQELVSVAMVVEPDIEADNGVIHGHRLGPSVPRGAVVLLGRRSSRKKNSRSGKRGKGEPSDPFRCGWQFSGSHALGEAYVSFLGAVGAAWDEAIVVRWGANPFGMPWPEMDAAFVTSGGGGNPPAAARRPALVILAG